MICDGSGTPPHIPMPGFNTGELELVELVNFASTCFVGTRLLKPLLSRALGGRSTLLIRTRNGIDGFQRCRLVGITARRSFSCSVNDEGSHSAQVAQFRRRSAIGAEVFYKWLRE